MASTKYTDFQAPVIGAAWLNDANSAVYDYGADTGSGNAYAVAVAGGSTGTLTALAAGTSVRFKATHANTGAATLDVNGIGAKALVFPDGAPLSAGTIPNGALVTAMYDGVAFQIPAVLTGGASRTFFPADLLTTNTGAQNDTAFLAAATAAQAAGGGIVLLPPGTFPHVHIAWNIATYPSVDIMGAGKAATILQKEGGSGTPVLEIATTLAITQCFRSYEGFSIVGVAKASPGLRTTLVASFTLRNIGISACSIGWENLGSLIATVYDCDFRGNAVGYRASRNALAVGFSYPNLISFVGGQTLGNSAIGFDFVHGQGITFDHVDIEQNGVFGNAATGGLFIRSTATAEISYGAYSLVNQTWFESNKGTSLVVEAAAGLLLTLNNTVFIRNNALTDGVAANIGAIECAILQNVFAVASVGNTFTVAASRTIIDGGLYTSLTDNSTNYNHRGVGTMSANIVFESGSSGSGITSSLDATGMLTGGTKVSKKVPLNGATTTVTLPVNINTTDPSGTLILVSGTDAADLAFTSVYLLAIIVIGGSGPNVAASRIGNVGSALTTFTFADTGGHVTMTAVAGKIAQVICIGN